MGRYKKVKKYFRSNRKRITEVDKDGNESVVAVSYKMKFIDSGRYMATPLSNLLDNLTEGILEIKCKNL